MPKLQNRNGTNQEVMVKRKTGTRTTGMEGGGNEEAMIGLYQLLRPPQSLLTKKKSKHSSITTRDLLSTVTVLCLRVQTIVVL